jgi:hypothetical protein
VQVGQPVLHAATQMRADDVVQLDGVTVGSQTPSRAAIRSSSSRRNARSASSALASVPPSHHCDSQYKPLDATRTGGAALKSIMAPELFQ